MAKKDKGCELTTIGRLMTPVSLLRVANKAIMVTRPTLSQHLGGKMVIMVMMWRVMMTMMTRTVLEGHNMYPLPAHVGAIDDNLSIIVPIVLE